MIEFYKSLPYSRRFLIKTAIFFTLFKGAISFTKKNNPKKMSWICQPLNHCPAQPSVEAFWSYHNDNLAYQLNSFFREQGWIIRDASVLRDDQRSALLTKEYKNSELEFLYAKLWSWMSSNKPKEQGLIAYQVTNQHIF